MPQAASLFSFPVDRSLFFLNRSSFCQKGRWGWTKGRVENSSSRCLLFNPSLPLSVCCGSFVVASLWLTILQFSSIYSSKGYEVRENERKEKWLPVFWQKSFHFSLRSVWMSVCVCNQLNASFLLLAWRRCTDRRLVSFPTTTCVSQANDGSSLSPASVWRSMLHRSVVCWQVKWSSERLAECSPPPPVSFISVSPCDYDYLSPVPSLHVSADAGTQR